MIARTAALLALGLGLRCRPSVDAGCNRRVVPVTRLPAPAITCPTGRGTSTLDGVTLVFPAQPCRFTVGQAQRGIALRYEIDVAHEVDGVVPAQPHAGNCTRPGPSGLLVGALISGRDVNGAGHHYCLCDEGQCAWTPQAIALHPGRYPGELTWDGRAWDGPSDTGRPHGPPFPAGVYTFVVTASGARDGTPFLVTRTMTFALVP